MIRKSDLQVVSLFSGCGGLDFGFEAAGYGVRCANDYDKYSCETLRLNRRENVLNAPIEEVATSGRCQDHRYSKRGACDVLVGGPPCQPFSKSAYWSKGDTLRLEDPRANTLDQYFRFVEDLLPRAFLLENVHGLNYNGKEEGFQFILQRIREINTRCGVHYIPSWAVLNVAEYGVPQLRVRFFLVACRNGNRFRFPQSTHIPVEEAKRTFLEAMGLSPYLSAWEAIGDIPEDKTQNLKVGGKWADLLPSVPEGENYLWHTDRKGGMPLFGWRTRYWSFLLKLAKRLPSWTIQAQPGSAIGPFHWDNRKLSWQEMAAIQTFPKTFLINSPRTEIQRQIGNAVPSLMSEILAREIASQVFDRSFDTPLTLSIPPRECIPDAQPVCKVPEKFMSLVGEHTAHPGTGLGNSHRKQMMTG